MSITSCALVVSCASVVSCVSFVSRASVASCASVSRCALVVSSAATGQVPAWVHTLPDSGQLHWIEWQLDTGLKGFQKRVLLCAVHFTLHCTELH